MSVRTGRLGNITIKKEAAWGTPITTDLLLRAASESIGRTIEHTEDNALVGEIYPTDKVKVADGAAGSLEGNAHGDEVGPLVHGALGGESSVEDPSDAFLICSYKGSIAYHRFTMATNSLTSETSPDGSVWTPDSNFGTAGVIDVSSLGLTATALQILIDGYSDYNATLFGSGTSLSTNIVDFAATLTKSNGSKVGAMNLKYQIAASTTAKTHTLFPADAATLLPSYTVLVNRVGGVDKSFAFTGTKFQSITFSNANKDLTKFSIPVTCREELPDQTDVNLVASDGKQLPSSGMKILVIKSAGTHVVMDEVKDHSLVVNTNIDENRVIGDTKIKEQIRQNSTIEISYTANNTDTQFALRDEYINDSDLETFLYWESNDDADITNSIPYTMLARIPNIKYSDFNSPLSTPDRLVISAAGSAVKPKNTVYTNHIEFLITDTEISQY